MEESDLHSGPAGPVTGVPPMSRLMAALDAAIDRYGRDAVADPVALAAALRAATHPPEERVVAALSRVAATGAVERLREALARDVEPAAAVTAALDAAPANRDVPGQPSARWALTVLGAALGLLPRRWADQADPQPGPPAADDEPDTPEAGSASDTKPWTPDTGAKTAPGTGDSADGPEQSAGPPARRRLGLAVLAGVVALAVAVAGYTALAPGSPAGPGPTDQETPAPPPAVTAAPDAEPAPSAAAAPGPQPSTTPAAPTDPRTVFLDPGMLALAEPYIALPGATCTADDDPDVNVQEHVTCDFGNGYVAIFSRYLTGDIMREIRDLFLQDHDFSSTVSLRWKFEVGRPGVKTGIPAGSPQRGEGVRIRFISADGDPLLYFDQDSTATSVLLGSETPTTLDALRTFWARPAG